MPKLKFFDVKAKKVFFSDKYKVVTSANGRKRAVTIAPSGAKAGVFVGKNFK